METRGERVCVCVRKGERECVCVQGKKRENIALSLVNKMKIKKEIVPVNSLV